MGKLILGLEIFPWDVLYRAAVGCAIMPVATLWFGAEPAASQLLLAFFAILVSLRIIPGVLRRVLPFPREVKNVWTERRALAKRYDSYQWRKLLGLGLGWLGYLLISRHTARAPFMMAGACLLAGLAGFACWRRVSRTMVAQPSSPVTG